MRHIGVSGCEEEMRSVYEPFSIGMLPTLALAFENYPCLRFFSCQKQNIGISKTGAN